MTQVIDPRVPDDGREHDHTLARWICGCDPTYVGILTASELTNNIDVKVLEVQEQSDE